MLEGSTDAFPGAAGGAASYCRGFIETERLSEEHKTYSLLPFLHTHPKAKVLSFYTTSCAVVRFWHNIPHKLMSTSTGTTEQPDAVRQTFCSFTAC